MKRLLILFTALFLTAALVGCGEKEGVKEPEKFSTVPQADTEERTEKGLGHYVDYIDRQGRAVGTRYITSDREVALRAGYHQEVLTVTVELAYPKALPFGELSGLSLGDYQVVDADDQVITDGKATEQFPLEAGKAVLTLELPQVLGQGIYHLKADHLVGIQENEQTLDLVGPWDFTFAVD